MAYLVKLDHFEGPLDLLLQLIEREELSITEVSLAKITDDYLTIIRAAKEIQPEELADFLVIAAKLILIKSQVLLPGIEAEQEEGPSLASQLKLYKEFLEASRKIEARIREKHFMFGRKKPLIQRVPEFLPPLRLTPEALVHVFRQVLKSLEPFLRLPKAAIERVISIQEKIARIRAMILDRVAVKFGEIMKEAKSRTEVIVSFLALLELVKQRTIEAKQDALFHEITLHKHNEAPSS